MRYISDAALTRQLLDEWDIPALFSTPNLNFSLVEYQPGEYLTAPYTKTERLLISGSGHHFHPLHPHGRQRICAALRGSVYIAG